MIENSIGKSRIHKEKSILSLDLSRMRRKTSGPLSQKPKDPFLL